MVPVNIPASLREEWQKMLDGEIYDAANPAFSELLMQTRRKLHDFNMMEPDQLDSMKALLREVFGSIGEPFHVNPPFRCDYGCNIHIGTHFFANFNLTILDEAEVNIGDHVFIGPNVSIYTACHPLDVETRNTGSEWAEPVTVGDNVWIGGNVVILPGVEIGANSVIGAGSVVTRSVPPSVVAAGNPAKVIKHIKQ